MIPVTNGLNNVQMYQTVYIKPKDLSQKGGELSVDYGKIPFLREKVKGRKKAKSLVRRHLSNTRRDFNYSASDGFHKVNM